MNSKTKKNVEIAVIIILGVMIVLSVVLIPLYFTGVIGKEPSGNTTPIKEKTIDPIKGIEFKAVSATSMPTGQYAEFIIDCKGKEYSVKVYLLSDYAPKTVENFVKYAKDGLYDGTVFYASDITYNSSTNKPTSAYLQGGAYTVDEEGNLIRKIPKNYYGKIEGEFYLNNTDTDNNISFIAGTIGMFHEDNDPNGADTEFFFLPYAHAEYNGYYAAFGIALESDDVNELFTCTEELYKAPTGEYPAVIKSVKIYTKK